jgi:hypothetical protein
MADVRRARTNRLRRVAAIVLLGQAGEVALRHLEPNRYELSVPLQGRVEALRSGWPLGMREAPALFPYTMPRLSVVGLAPLETWMLFRLPNLPFLEP